MKGIYFTTFCNIENPCDKTDPGIKTKIRQQFELFKKNDCDMFFYYAHNESRFYRFARRMPFFRDKFDLSQSVIADTDFIYIRKPSSINMGYIVLLKKIRKTNPKIKILMEIPTYPYDHENKRLLDIPLKLKDRYARNRLKKYIDVILTYSDDKEIFGIKTINISNGVNAIKVSEAVKKHPYQDDGKIRFIACARFCLWHGYDRAIEGLHRYYQNQNALQNIEIEFVGDGPSTESYKQLVEEYGLQEHVKFYGKRLGDDLIKIYSKCDIGLDSMGRHRSGVLYNSSLKGKEYCACGLMVVSGVKTELDSAEDFKYYYRIPADDSPLDFEKVIAFYNEKVGEKKTNVKNEIMDYAISHFSMEVIFKPVIDYIKQ